MKDLNKIILIGRLGNDPIRRETKNGISVVHFSLATARRVRDSGNGEPASEGVFGQTETPAYPAEETVWHRVTVWGRQADTCAQYLKKGDHVYVEGSIRSHKYDGKDGVQRVAFEVHADSVGFLGARRGKREESQQAEVAMG